MKAETVELGEVCDFTYGDGLKEEKRRNGKVPVYGSNGIVGWHDKAITSGPTIIVGRKGSIGEVNWSNKPCFPIDTTYYIEKTKIPCDLRWLYYALLKLDLTRLNKSAAVPGLNRDDAYEQRIIFPSTIDQKKVADCLDKANRLRLLRRYALEMNETFLQSVFIQSFGVPDTNTRKLPTEQLEELTDLISSGSTPLGGSSVYQRCGVMFIRSQNVLMTSLDLSDVAYISEDIHNHMRRTHVQKGDVLFNITGASIGRVAEFDLSTKANVNQHVCIIRCKDDVMLPTFLTYHISIPSYQTKILANETGATRQAFTFDQIKQFKVILPSTKQQMEFVNFVGRYRRLQFSHVESLRQSEHLFQSLLYQAFSGN